MTSETTWELRDDIDPEPLRKAEAQRAEERQDEFDRRAEERQDDRDRVRAGAEARSGPFRQQLGTILGTEVPKEAIKITQDHQSYEITVRLLEITEATDRNGFGNRERLYPRRYLTAVWTDDDQIHIRVTGDPQLCRTLRAESRAKTWNAGPIATTQDLLRIIEQRGDVQWRPTPGNEPQEGPETTHAPTAAGRAQTMLDQLSRSPRNHYGLRGVLIALAWSNLATTEQT